MHRIPRFTLQDAAWVATEEKRNFVVRYSPIMIHHMWNAKFYKLNAKSISGEARRIVSFHSSAFRACHYKMLEI